MLASAHRLRRRAEFSATVKGGRRAARGALVVHMKLPATDQAAPPGADAAFPQGTQPAPAEVSPPPRAGFVVSRAVGGAVVRNRVKRRLRHLMQARIGALPAGAMLVVRALPAAADRSHAGLGTDLDGALARLTTGRRR